MATRNILVIEDEDDILELVTFHLKLDGYSTSIAATGEDGLRLLRTTPPDLVILDRMLPGIDGLEICRIIKQDAATRHIPVVMLTAKSEEIDVITGLELGADDYITKPFSPRILLARVRAVLRRQNTPSPEEKTAYQIQNLTIHPGRYTVAVDGAPVELTLTEFHILQLLSQRPGWVFSRYQIVDAIRGEDYIVTERSVDVHIVGLRKKLGDAGQFIETVRGVGYRFKE